MCADTPSDARRITRPYSKLSRLCEQAAARGGTVTTFAAVAKAIGLTPGRVTQVFGYAQEAEGSLVRPGMLGRIAEAFVRDGVHCEVDWLHLHFDEFAARAAEANASARPRQVSDRSDAPAGGWAFTEATALPGLVELRLHPPRPGNELPDSYYADATLLFGTAAHDYQPDDGEDPRTVAIALRRALLTIGSDGHRPLKGSMIGERTECEHYQRVAGGVEIVGPAPKGTLEGSPIDDQYLAVIAGTPAGDEPFAVTVAANWGSFVVSDAEAPTAPPGANRQSGNKAAILNALIYKHAAKDTLGRPLLAHATMRRSPKGADPES
jgi:hypothetical protein